MAGPAGPLTADLHSLHNVLLYSPSFLGHQLCAWVGVEVGPRSPRHSPRAQLSENASSSLPRRQREGPQSRSPALPQPSSFCPDLSCPRGGRTELQWPHLSPGEGNGNPLQCSCLENPRDGGAWWAAVYEIAQSRTRLK